MFLKSGTNDFPLPQKVPRYAVQFVMIIHTSRAGWIMQDFDLSMPSKLGIIPSQTNDLHSRQIIRVLPPLEAGKTRDYDLQIETIGLVCHS